MEGKESEGKVREGKERKGGGVGKVIRCVLYCAAFL
jgi:hypothetical protein